MRSRYLRWLNLNIGTPSEERFEAMRIAARMAAKKNIPIVLDLVGVGVSASGWIL